MMASTVPRMFYGDGHSPKEPEASYLYALVTGKRSVSRRNMASWYLRQLNKLVKCDPVELVEKDDISNAPVRTDQVHETKLLDNENSTPEIRNDDGKDIFLVSIVDNLHSSEEVSTNLTDTRPNKRLSRINENQRSLVTPNTRVFYFSKAIAATFILDLSPSVVSVSPQNGCVFLDSMFDALKRSLNLLVKEHQFPSSKSDQYFTMAPRVFVSVIAYTPFVIAKNNQVLMQNRRISSLNIDQVLVELWICLNRLIQELHELVTSTCGIDFEFENHKPGTNAFVFATPLNSNIIRHPGSVLDDIFELGLFSSSLMPRLSRLSIIIITDGLFSSSNNLSTFRLKNIAVSFISLASESIYPDACFGYTTYNDLMRFVAKSTQGVYISHNELMDLTVNSFRTKELPLTINPFYRLFGWSLHSDIDFAENHCTTPRLEKNVSLTSSMTAHALDPMIEMKPEYIAKLFCIDQPVEAIQTSSASSNAIEHSVDMDLVSNQNYHDWRSFKQMSRNLDADFEQVLSCLLREGYLIKSIQLKQRETSNIVARLVLYWKHNLNLEQELQAPYWNSADPFELGETNNLILKPFLAPTYGDTYCEVIVHGSYNFLHDFFCDKKLKRRSDYRAVAYQQFEHLIIGVRQTYDKLQYLSRFYREANLSKVPSFLLHGNSLLFEQPHTHNLTSTIDNVVEKTRQAREFSDYWQEISKLELRNWKNIMHVHTLRLILEHDQPKFKNIHCQNANGRYTHIQCRRAMSAISNFIRSYASFALLEDSLYIRFIHNKEDDLCDIETSATKGFVVIRIKKILPIVVIYLMFTSGILDSHRAQIVDHIEDQLMACKLRSTRTSTTVAPPAGGPNGSIQSGNILRSKVIHSSGDSSCALIRSPLERMLRFYGRTMIGEFLSQNPTHGLPGSCPLNPLQRNPMPTKTQKPNAHSHIDEHKGRSASTREDQLEDYNMENNLTLNSRYNPVFGKYLYGIRVIHTISSLPHELVHQMVQNVLVKISAILMNVRIKQGFRIAFNNSGLLTLVTELELKDYSHDFHSSTCLCQYLAFPPTVTNCCSHIPSVKHESPGIGATGSISRMASSGLDQADSLSRPASYCGSVNAAENPLNQHDTSGCNLHEENNQGEIKVIREYWIEQQYGISTKSSKYHSSLENMRYSEVVDHLYLTDKAIFDSLLTYDLLQSLCDKMSPFYELDVALSQTETRNTLLFSPTDSTTSSSLQPQNSPLSPTLPSSLLEGTSKDGSSRVPLIELDYQFSLVKFLDFCQFASLDVVLFRDLSEFFCKLSKEFEKGNESMSDASKNNEAKPQENDELSNQKGLSNDGATSNPRRESRRLSIDVGNMETNQSRREHRSSYDSLNVNSSGQVHVQPITGYSLNHLFLETLHKRLKQIHDKDLRLPECDKKEITSYLRKRKIQLEYSDDSRTILESTGQSPSIDNDLVGQAGEECRDASCPTRFGDSAEMSWRCFMRKGNQENLMIVLLPDSLDDVKKWRTVNDQSGGDVPMDGAEFNFQICPIFVFRCSSTMINDQVLSFLNNEANTTTTPDLESLNQTSRAGLESDLSLHFGQPCKTFNRVRVLNDELYNEILPPSKFNELSQGISDENTQELIHFRAFLRKIKNTVLKSRFSSLNDAYLSELFVHKDDISYYINNVDPEIQKKYHVSSHLRGLAHFIKSYELYHEALPKEPKKQCNQLLNSILLQKCGLFINQPLARFDDANPLMKQLHDRKLLFMMRCNYKIELPTLEENLSNSKFLRGFLREASTGERVRHHHHHQKNLLHNKHQQSQARASISANNSNQSTQDGSMTPNGQQASSLGRMSNPGSRLMEMKCGSIGSASALPSGSSPANSVKMSIGTGESNYQLAPDGRHTLNSAEYGSLTSSNINSILSPSSDSFFLEAFKDSVCSMDEVIAYGPNETMSDVGLRHEAHMAEVLRRKGERKESHHYRRVLKSKTNYSQSHSAIDQALKRVDSLGRLEHFCLTPLLFSPAWRVKLAPVRDHTVGTIATSNQESSTCLQEAKTEESSQASCPGAFSAQDETNERWHQMICNNYIKEYEQYIQTLGFNSVQIRFPSSSKLQTSLSSVGISQPEVIGTKSAGRKTSLQTTMKYSSGRKSTVARNRRDSSTNSPSTSFIPITTYSPLTSQPGSGPATVPKGHVGNNTNTGYLIKFLNSGCLVFKVGFCKPYVYSILYSIEGERFNNTNTKVNMTAFLDELDSIKVTLHLHSFTYDYHLRSMYSYIARRQIDFNPGYHLISFADDFLKYYQKAPNYARNHVLSGEVQISSLKVDGQQLYNYIVTHNSIYQLEVLEMTNANAASLMQNLNAATLSDDPTTADGKAKSASQQFASFLSSQFGTSVGSRQDEAGNLPMRNHANDYVLIELKREKVHYKDGKEPDVFDCGLLIAHDYEKTGASKSSLVLRYFLILTNQRDLYPKLLHTNDTLVGLGCHRPIRLGAVDQLGAVPSALTRARNSTATASISVIEIEASDANDETLIDQRAILKRANVATMTGASVAHQEDHISASDWHSSDELSGPQSNLSTVDSIRSSSSTGPEYIRQQQQQQQQQRQLNVTRAANSDTDTSLTTSSQKQHAGSSIDIDQLKTEEAAEALIAEEFLSASKKDRTRSRSSVEAQELSLKNDSSACGDTISAQSNGNIATRPDATADHQMVQSGPEKAGEKQKQHEAQQQEPTICDEEITYLGYFSSDEMDMLKFLQEKTASLKNHLEQVVHQAEIHFRRDYLWHKLMQRQSFADQSISIMGSRSSSSVDQMPLSTDELIQLLSVVEAIDLVKLDPELETFTTMHTSWYLKLMKAFTELKLSPAGCQHRIYSVKASKSLLLYIDPKCTTAFVLLSVNVERGSVELSMLLKDKQDCCSDNSAGLKSSSHSHANGGKLSLDLDTDCQQLITDFVNFCATFMWANLLT